MTCSNLNTGKCGHCAGCRISVYYVCQTYRNDEEREKGEPAPTCCGREMRAVA